MLSLLLALAACAPKAPEPVAAPEPAAAPAPPPTPVAPVARVGTETLALHGTTLADPYRWLEDEKAADVQAWMAGQDDAARAQLRSLPARAWLQKRFRELYAVDSVGVPVQRDTRLFYTRRAASQDKAVLYWRDAGGAETVLIDTNAWARLSPPKSLGDWTPSPDGKLVAFQEKPNAADEATLKVIDVATGAVSEADVIPGAKYASVSWTPDSKGFYYEWLPTDPAIPVDARPGYTEERFHALGTDPAKDPIIHGKTGDPATFLDGYLSDDGNYLFIQVMHGWNAIDTWVKDLRKDKDFKPLVVGQPFIYVVDEHQDQFYIYTDDGGPKKHVYRARAKKPARKDWVEIVKEDAGATLDGFGIVGGRLALTYMKDVKTEIRWVDLDGKNASVQTLPGLGVASFPSGEKDSKVAYYTFSSFTSPPQIYSLDLASRQSSVWAKIEVPVKTEDYTSEQVWFKSKDGTSVPMFLIHRKDVVAGGNHPTLLYGYGGFDVSLLPDFKSGRYPFLEAGGVYAVANLRGGGEFGKAWHEAGQLDKKQNVFDDYISAARHLIDTGWTSPDKLAINGGSNGGLLMGAALTQAPELYRAVVCAVPLLDMIRYVDFGSGRTWIPEYGDPANEAQFKTLAAYSPYHNVKPGTDYPDLLMLSADHDDRVDPMHARKFVAAVAAADKAGATPLLRIERNAGHGGADNVQAAIDYSADMYAFLFDRLGMKAPE